MENVKKFYEALATNEELKVKAAKLSEKYEGKQPDEATIVADLVAFAKDEGYSFTAAELSTYAESVKKDAADELKDDELEVVSGGVTVIRCPGDACWQGNCLCIMGGGGKHNTPKITCVCVIGGGGGKCPDKLELLCVIGGGVVS